MGSPNFVCSKVKLVSGKKEYVKETSLLGYCTYHLHKGHLTKKLLDVHECIQKQCPHLVRFEHEFWKQLKRKKEDKENARIQRKEDAARKAKEEEAENKRVELYIDDAYDFIEDNQYDIDVIRMQKMKSQVYYVFYVSSNNFLDSDNYLPLSQYLEQKYGFFFILRQIVRPDGQYATPEDFGLEPIYTRDESPEIDNFFTPVYEEEFM